MNNPYGPIGIYPSFNSAGIMQPSAFQPQGMAQPPVNNIIKVSGMDGAKAYQLPPNSFVVLLHDSEDVMYIKSTDGAGFPTIRTFTFTEKKEEPAAAPSSADFITREEFEAFKKEIAGGRKSGK